MLTLKMAIDGEWDRLSQFNFKTYIRLHNRCEYIFYRSLYRTAYARVSRGVVTDTEMQIAQFTIPKYGVGVTNDTKDARMLRSFKEDLPEYHVNY